MNLTLSSLTMSTDEHFNLLPAGREARTNWSKYFSKNVRLRRQEMGLTGEQLGNLVGVSRHGVSRVEAGESVPTLETAEKYAIALHVPLLILLSPQPKNTVVFIGDKVYQWPGK